MASRARALRTGIPWWGGAACALGVALATLSVRALGWLEPLELRGWDQLLRWRPAPETGPVRVAVVLVEEADIQRFGHPLPDAVLAELVAGLTRRGATAVGVDLYRDRPVEPGHAALRDRVLGDDRVVMVEKLPGAGTPGVAPPPFLQSPDTEHRVGFSDLVVDADGVVRRNLLFSWDESGRAHASLSLRLALRHLHDLGIGLEPDPRQPQRLALGASWLTPLDADEGGYVGADFRGYQLLLDYAGAPASRPAVSLGDWLDGRVPEDFFRGRVVLVGTRAPSVRDDFRTPLGSALLLDSRRGGPAEGIGVAVHALAVDQLLRMALDGDAPVRGWRWPATAAAVAILAFAGALLGSGLRSPWWLLGSVAGLAALVVGGALGAATRSVWLPWPLLVLAMLGAAAAGLALASQRERARRALLQQLFGRYLSAEVADHLQERSDEFLSGGRPSPRRLTETVLMMDIEGSSLAAEQMDAGEFLEWIDRGLGTLTRTVEEHGGIVEYFSGDGLKVDFGVPIARSDPAEVAEDARRAARAALAAGEALEQLNAERRPAGAPRMRVRMGIHTGETVAGSIGSDRRLQYTTLGGTANLAARLESLDKETFRDDPARPDWRILVSEETRRHLDDATSAWCLRPAGSVSLGGPSRHWAVFELQRGAQDRSQDRSQDGAHEDGAHQDGEQGSES
ncbi:MAG: CHASE2 domain-containing protein [Myxococcota bacterium]